MKLKPLKELLRVIIAVEQSTAQGLHVNPQPLSGELNDSLTWSVRVTGDFVIIMNNRFALPVIIRHPQRFKDSRSFVAEFKREFINLLAMLPVPHAKIRLVRDGQFDNIQFTVGITADAAAYLKTYQNLLTGPNEVINWDAEPTNTEIALQLAEETWMEDDQDNSISVMTAFERYTMENYHVPAHPTINDNNRKYLYQSASLNDVLNAVAVSQVFLADYHDWLDQRGKSDQIIDRDTDVAADYCSYCEVNGASPLDDLTMPYYYLLHYRENSDEDVSDTQLKEVATALRELARFMRLQKLFSDEDYEQFGQAIAQSGDDRYSPQRYYHFQRMVKDLQIQLNDQRQAIVAPRAYAKRRIKVRAKLADYSPKIWREFEVGGDTRLDKLCMQVLASFKAQGSHLFDLQAGQTNYQLPVMESGFGDAEDLSEHWLGEFPVGSQFTLNYDFGDSWQFNIELVGETEQSRLQNDGHAHLINGFGSGIIEDIGGVDGLRQAAQDDPTINRQLDVDTYQKQWGNGISRLQRAYSIRWYPSQVPT